MYINTNQEKKNKMFKVWDTLGVSWKNSKYVSEKFYSMEDYFKTLAEYYGVRGVSGLKELIINDSNEVLSLSVEEGCKGGTIRMYNIDIEKNMGSQSSMFNMYEYGHGNKPTGYYAYSEDPNFECNDEEALKYGDCYDVTCLMPPISKVNQMLQNKYGFSSNTEVNDEKYMDGNIRIQSYGYKL